MSRFRNLLRFSVVFATLLTFLGCQALFSEFRINDAAFTQPILVKPTKGLFTTEWGGQATFTIVLDHQPTANVTVGLSSTNIIEGTVSPASVTFTKDDWKAPQVVTVTGQDDPSPDHDKTYRISTAAAVSDDPAFDGKNPADVELVNIDNETAGITVVPRSGLSTSENGGQDTFTVVLNSEPKNDVTIALTSSNTMEGTVSPESLVFTPRNWRAPQLVTVTGVDDGDLKDPKHAYKINVSATSEDQNYNRFTMITVDVVNEDNESAGLTVALVSGIDPIDSTKLRTSENLDSATFTVALNSPPVGDVTIPVVSDATGEGTVSPESLTFTPLNWNAPQTVTVTGVDDDAVADGDQPYTIVLGPSTGDDPDYNAEPATNVPVFNVDNDKPGFTLMLLSGIDPQDSRTLLTSESGTTATFSLALNFGPESPVTINIASSLPSEADVSPKSLTFTPDNWRAPQIVSVTGRPDGIQDGSAVFSVITGVAVSDPRYALDPPDVQVKNQDIDSAGLRIDLRTGLDPSDSNRLVTQENGGTATFTVALTSKPTAAVTIPVSSSNEKEGTLWVYSLTFTPANYAAPQTVTIAGVDDEIVDGNQPYFVTLGPATGDDSTYAGKFMRQLSVTNIDDDSAGVIVTPTSGLSTSEKGTTASFAIHLQSKPKYDVSIRMTSSAPTEGSLNASNVSIVTFTALNWNANQTVVVTGQEDGVQDGNQTYKIVFDPADSKDLNYAGKRPPLDVTLTNIDNDSAGFVVTPTADLVTTEGGGKATFTIALTSKPVSTASPGTSTTVKFTLSSSRPLEGKVSPTTLIFDDKNWKSAQVVTVTGMNDDAADGPQPYLIAMGLAQSVDENYNNHKATDVSVTNIDDDSASLKILPMPTQTPTATSEIVGGTSTFTVALTSLPSSDVTFTLTSTNENEGKVSPATLKFSPTNGKTPQTVTVTGGNDDLADGDQQYSIVLSNAISSDTNYGGKFGIGLPFVNIDDDHAGYRIVAAPNLKTSEDGGTATFTVALWSQPNAPVSIALSSSDTSEGEVMPPTTLSFNSDNWSKPQTVTIVGKQDEGVADGTQTYQVKLADAVSPGDPNYDGKYGTPLEVQNLDDDQPGYTVIAGSMLQTKENGEQATFNVVLKSKPKEGTTVRLGLESGNDKEGSVSPSQLIFTPSDWNQPQLHAVTVTGVDDKKVDGDVAYQITFIPDPTYWGEKPSPVALTNLDDDTLGVLVTPTTCSTTPGTTATFSIRLKSQPSASVTISFASDTPTAGSVPPGSSVTFTNAGTGSWDTPQTITVTGGTDGTTSMPAPYSIVTADAVAPGDSGYNGFVVPDVSCTNQPPP